MLKTIRLISSTCLLVALTIFHGNAQNTNLSTLISSSEWEALFPKRAGTSGNHPQGISTDFYSYDNLIQAVDDLSDFVIEITRKDGVWGEYITITRKSTGNTYVYSDVDAWWHSNNGEETVVTVDFGDFLNRPSATNNKRELASFLANISKETTGGWEFPVGGGSFGDYADWGLYYVYELGIDTANSGGTYSNANTEYPPNPSVGYYGRGPIQLSYNENYGQLSKFLYNDASILLNDPDKLRKDGVLAFKSAIWFWMMPQCPKPSCHEVMHDLWESDPADGDYASGSKMYGKGFMHTNNIINGGLECRNTSTSAFTEKVVMRSELYKYYLGIMGFSANEIASENLNGYSTSCHEGSSNTMEAYQSCELKESVVTGTDEVVDINPQLDYYPNPITNQLTLQHEEQIQSVQFIDAFGQIVFSKNVYDNQAVISVETIKAGYYTLVVQTNQGITNYKVVKE